jgi:hypothetical protein
MLSGPAQAKLYSGYDDDGGDDGGHDDDGPKMLRARELGGRGKQGQVLAPQLQGATNYDSYRPLTPVVLPIARVPRVCRVAPINLSCAMHYGRLVFHLVEHSAAVPGCFVMQQMLQSVAAHGSYGNLLCRTLHWQARWGAHTAQGRSE